MTIAICYVSAEGVVLGADSTSTYYLQNSPHYFNHAQKIFEIGESSTYGLVCWSLAGFGETSYRTLVGRLADDLQATPPTSVQDVANKWAAMSYAEYSTSTALSTHIARCKALAANSNRTVQEQEEFDQLRTGLVAGFCIAGYHPSDRVPTAFEILLDPLQNTPVISTALAGDHYWGAPNMVDRLMRGYDHRLPEAIKNSGHWTGTDADLMALFSQYVLEHPLLPMREVVDFVHACIMATIKAFKFSPFSQICGGPVEIAVITTDRKFRWVRHKSWSAAIEEGKVSSWE